MRATVMYGAGDVRIETVPDARLIEPTDALVVVKHAAICGSDLWPYKTMPHSETAHRMGHEMGMNMNNHDLFDAVNAGVKWLWRTKTNAKDMQKYGVGNPDYLVPPAKNPRLGVDRDANGNILGPGAHTPKDFSSFFQG
jgi:Alcohol dehydrogenase GroES-like domain